MHALTGLSPSLVRHTLCVGCHSRQRLSGDAHNASFDTTLPKRNIPPQAVTPGRFCAGLFPFQSPLLRESLLFSSPLLTDMLKSGRYTPVPKVCVSKHCLPIEHVFHTQTHTSVSHATNCAVNVIDKLACTWTHALKRV